MGVEAGHVQLTEIKKEVFPQINWMIEDLFCRYGVSIPYFILDFEFPDYSQRPEWVTGYRPDWYLPEWESYWPTFINQWPNWFEGTGFNFNLDWGEWGYYLPWFNELLGLLFDEADLPRWQMPDFSPGNIEMLNSQMSQLYEGVSVTNEYEPVGGTTLRNMRRAGYSDTYANAKTEYEDDPRYCDSYTSSYLIYVRWGIYHSSVAGDTEYQIAAHQGYAKFDTTEVASVSSAKFVLDVNTVTLTGVTTNPTLYIYKQDFGDDLECAEWTGGTKLVAEREFTTDDDGEEVEISIETGDVVTEDYSRYRFTFDTITDESYWSEPDVGDTKKHQITCDNIKLVLT